MFVTKLEKETLDNQYYRKVIFTSKKMQLVLMNLPVNTNIPAEIHEDHDQFIRVEEGTCIVKTPTKTETLNDGDAVIIEAGTEHEVINTGKINLKLYSIYTPPEHKDGLTQKYDNGKLVEVLSGGTSVNNMNSVKNMNSVNNMNNYTYYLKYMKYINKKIDY
jgi:mannose-6-phosphate isomerase-like protein (cupin superfamily)